MQPTPLVAQTGSHRVEGPGGHRLLEVRQQRLLADLLAGEVAVHQPLVLGLLDDRLDQRVAAYVVARGVEQVADPGHRAALVDGDQHRHHLVAERRLRRRHHAVVVGAGMVELGHHDGARHAHLGALAPQVSGRLVDRLVRGDDEERRVGRPEAGPHLAAEVGVPGGVEEVHLGARVHQRGHRQRHRPLVCLLRFLEVAHRRPVDDRAGAGDRARRGQQGLQQRGLARSTRPDQHHVAQPVGPGRFEIVLGGLPSAPVRHEDHETPPGGPAQDPEVTGLPVLSPRTTKSSRSTRAISSIHAVPAPCRAP